MYTLVYGEKTLVKIRSKTAGKVIRIHFMIHTSEKSDTWAGSLLPIFTKTKRGPIQKRHMTSQDPERWRVSKGGAAICLEP